MTLLFSQLMKLPVDVFVYSMEMVVQTMRGIQHITYQGFDMMAGGNTLAHEGVADNESVVPEVTHVIPEGASQEHAEARQIAIQKEERYMADKDLHDDMLKLVRYKVLFVKRDYEHAFKEEEELVSENTDAAGYSSWKIAEFIQKLDELEIPSKWREKKYPPNAPANATKIGKLPEEDKKYLRVYYEVLDRYPRERFKYEERQIEVLEQIRDKMK